MANSTSPPAVSHAAIVHEIEIGAPPVRVFDALTNHIARWWSHVTYETTDRPTLILESRAGGRFYEVSGHNERLYATVTRYEPGSQLWLQGAMGMSGCVFGTITFGLQPKSPTATILVMSHEAIGILDEEAISMYRAGWISLLEDGLKRFVEDGTEAWSVA